MQVKNVSQGYSNEEDNNKINILFNKFNKNSIDINILKIIFSEYNIIGKIDINNNKFKTCQWKEDVKNV